jgi:hypothetical protein
MSRLRLQVKLLVRALRPSDAVAANASARIPSAWGCSVAMLILDQRLDIYRLPAPIRKIIAISMRAAMQAVEVAQGHGGSIQTLKQ